MPGHKDFADASSIGMDMMLFAAKGLCQTGARMLRCAQYLETHRRLVTTSLKSKAISPF